MCVLFCFLFLKKQNHDSDVLPRILGQHNLGKIINVTEGNDIANKQ